MMREAGQGGNLDRPEYEKKFVTEYFYNIHGKCDEFLRKV